MVGWQSCSRSRVPIYDVQISKRTKGLQNMVARMVDVADREALWNGLGEIAEAYEEGWDSGSDVDSD